MNPQFTITQDNQKFTIEPLPQGYGHTLGNALRRVLYTSIPGAAITSVQFSGANHQFTSIDGVSEDVVQLILNLKQVRMSYSGKDPVTMSLSVKGPGEVKAGDFKTPATVKIVNPDLVIAHLSDKTSKLEAEVTVESGLGYSPAEEQKNSTMGVIPVDATFSPITLVNYTVEATRVGRVTNFDKLVLDITSDGTVSVLEALTAAAQTLVEYFSVIAHPQVAPAATHSSSSPVSTSQTPGANVSIEELDLPTRIANALQKSGFDTVASLLATKRSDLAKIKNLGSKSVKIVELALREHGFDLAL